MTEFTYSRPGGMSQQEREKTLRRLAGGTTSNASGARQEAPAILAGSEPSKELQQPKLTPEEEAIAEANRKARGMPPAPTEENTTLETADPVNGEVDPLDAVHEAAIDLPPEATATENLDVLDEVLKSANENPVAVDPQPAQDSLFD